MGTEGMTSLQIVCGHDEIPVHEGSRSIVNY